MHLMYKTRSTLFLVLILILPTVSASAEITSRQRGDLLELLDEVSLCKARYHVVASGWIDLAWETKENDGKWTKVSKHMLTLSREVLEFSYKFETLRSYLSEILGLSEEAVFSMSSRKLDHANEEVPEDQDGLTRYMDSYMNTCTQVALSVGRAVKDL